MFTWLGLLEASAIGGICIVLFFLISLLFGERYRAGARKVIWLLIALRMCIPISSSLFPKPFTVQIPVYVLQESSQIADTDNALLEGLKSEDESQASGNKSNMADQSKIRRQLTLQDILVILWGTGSAAVLIFHISAHFFFCRKMYTKSEECMDSHILKTVATIAEEIGLKSIAGIPQVRLIKDAQTGPFTVGFLQNIIYLPDADYQEKDLWYIIRHELTHCASRDTQAKLLFVIVSAVHWFNPFVWLMKYLADQDMELACDEKVLKNTSKEERSEYGEVLMSYIGTDKIGGLVLSTEYVQGVKFIKKRFRNIFDMREKSGKAVVCVMIVFLIAVSAGIGFETGRIVYAKNGIAIDCGIELRTDVTGDGQPDRVCVFDNNDVLITSVTLNTAEGQAAQIDYDEGLWASSYLVSGDLNGNEKADIVLMRISSGMHVTGPVSVLYAAEEAGKFVWQEYPKIFVYNSSIDMEQPKTFDDIECIGATVIEEGNGHYLRLIALDMEYLAETLGDDDQVLCIDCSWQGDGWFIENMQTIPGYYSEHKEESLLKNNIYD